MTADGSLDSEIKPEGMLRFCVPAVGEIAPPVGGRELPWSEDEVEDEAGDAESSDSSDSSSSSSRSSSAASSAAGEPSDSTSSS